MSDQEIMLEALRVYKLSLEGYWNFDTEDRVDELITELKKTAC